MSAEQAVRRLRMVNVLRQVLDGDDAALTLAEQRLDDYDFAHGYARELDRCDPIQPGRDGTDRGTAGRKRDPLTGMFRSGGHRG